LIYGSVYEVKDVLAELNNRYPATHFSGADSYVHGSMELHVHCSFEGSERCAVIQPASARLSGVVHTDPVDFPTNPIRDQTWGEYREVHVFVAVPESVDVFDDLDIARFVPGVFDRLQTLEDCDRTRIHPPSDGVPFPSVVKPLQTFAVPGLFPNSLPEDWERYGAAILRWDQGTGDVVEPRVHVVEEIGSDQSDSVRGRFGEFRPILVVLLLHPSAYRVRILSSVGVNLNFEITEVLLGPIQLQDVRGNEITHAES
jgi:hypothetical protein